MHRGGIHGGPPPAQGIRRASRGGHGGARPGNLRSRSRSRSPVRGGRFRNERDSRDLGRDRDRNEREQRDRERKRSKSPYAGGSTRSTGREKERDKKPPATAPSPSKPSTSASATLNSSMQAISIVNSEAHASIIRRILNPEDVKIPRRVSEGAKPIFDREELREAMIARIRSNDNEENPVKPNAYIQEPTVTQQRVVAIIREPPSGSSHDLYLSAKEKDFHQTVRVTGADSSQRITSDSEGRARSFSRRSPSPKGIRPGPSRPGRSPPPLMSSSRARSVEREQRERERLIAERERALEREREELMREREHLTLRERGGARPLIPHPERDLRDNRDRDVRDHHRPDLRNERERENPERRSRFNPAGGPAPPPQQAHPPHGDRPRGIRSRSPVTRVAREDVSRIRRRSRSHSVTPPPMPEEFRRQLIIDRQKQVDLRSSLSRPPGRPGFGDGRAKARLGHPPGRGGGRGGRGGGFISRSVRGREERRAWLHDMFDGGDEPRKG